MSYESRGYYRSRQDGKSHVWIRYQATEPTRIQATITVDLVEEDVTEVNRIKQLTVFDLELTALYKLDDRRGPRRRRSPPRDDDVEDIEVRLRGLIIKIGDKVYYTRV